MRIVVSDSSCLIDLRKASLLDIFLRLPYELLIPNTLFEEELLKFTAVQKAALVRGGLKVIDLPGDRVLRAQQVVRKVPTISVHDGFAFLTAIPTALPAFIYVPSGVVGLVHNLRRK